MARYFVTYCITTKPIANPFGHSCFIISKQDTGSDRINVVDIWGYYGPTATGNDGYWRRLKKKLGLDINLTGSHGLLVREESRHFDQGVGLQGLTHELTEDAFNALNARCQQVYDDERQAIKEAAQALELKPITDKGAYRLYQYEHYSPEIFEWEQQQALAENRPCRLKPFELRIGLDYPSIELTNPAAMLPISMNSATTCKTGCTEILKEFVPQAFIDNITNHQTSLSMPRNVVKLSPIILRSDGELLTHISKRTGEKQYFRDFYQGNSTLFWAFPPKRASIKAEDASPENVLPDNEFELDAKKQIKKLIQLKWLVESDSLIDDHNRKALLGVINDALDPFAKSDQAYSKQLDSAGFKSWLAYDSWARWGTHLLGLPADEWEHVIYCKTQYAKATLNAIYMSIVERSYMTEAEPEASVLQLSIASQKKACQIMGRTYVVDDWQLDEQQAPVRKATTQIKEGSQLAPSLTFFKPESGQDEESAAPQQSAPATHSSLAF